MTADSTPSAGTLAVRQYLLTPAMGKRLIARAVVRLPAVRAVLRKGRLVVIAGSTNGYVAEEILKSVEQVEGFDRKGFRRGMVTPPGFKAPDGSEFAGDVVLVDGAWERGKTVFDVADDLQTGDVVLKGANAVDLRTGNVAVYIGHPQGGTILAALAAVVGRRVQLVAPVGLEKRVCGDLGEIASMLNAANAGGPRMLPLPGPAFTELDAIALLTGAQATLVAGGGIYGAEGCVYVAVRGTAEQIEAVGALVAGLRDEPPCEV